MSVWNPSGSDNAHVDVPLPGISVGWNNMPYEVKMSNGRHCVYKKGTNKKFGCHDTHGEALEQMAALYSKEGGKMSSSFLVSMETVKLSDDNTSWVHALPLGSYKHPVYGVIDISVERARNFAESVKKKVRGIDPSINYNHNGGEEAAGWVKDAEVRANGVWLFVDWVKDAAEKIKDKKFRYFSAEFDNQWEDPEGNKYTDVIMGGALTNRPFMKNLVPVNLSESVIDNAFDLVAGITGQPVEKIQGKETHMGIDEKDLKAIIDGVTANLSESLKLTPAKKTVENPVTKLEEIEDLKKLAEDNPLLKSMFKRYEEQATLLAENTKHMREVQVEAKLSEFKDSKLTLTPVAMELAREIMLEMPEDLTEKFSEFMGHVRSSTSFLVELGERSGAAVKRGRSTSDKSATQIFSERVEVLMAEDKLDFMTAAGMVAKEDPELYARYRAGDGAPASN